MSGEEKGLGSDRGWPRQQSYGMSGGVVKTEFLSESQRKE